MWFGVLLFRFWHSGFRVARFRLRFRKVQGSGFRAVNPKPYTLTPNPNPNPVQGFSGSGLLQIPFAGLAARHALRKGLGFRVQGLGFRV